jgi:hypothetical protein
VQCGHLLADSGGWPTGYADASPDNPGSGSFARLVNAVYEYATGYAGTRKGAGLAYYIKQVARLFEREQEILEMAAEANPDGTIRPLYLKQLSAIDEQLHDPVGPPLPIGWSPQDGDEGAAEQAGKEDS